MTLCYSTKLFTKDFYHYCVKQKVCLFKVRHLTQVHPIDVSVTVDHGVKKKLDSLALVNRQEYLRRLTAGEDLYPTDYKSIMWRTCEQELEEPIKGTTTGTIPTWLKGSLLRNGPGTDGVGDTKFQHWFDGAALVHRFAIAEGSVTYQCRFLKTDSYVKNKAENRVVHGEFGTASTPDPCRTIFHRISSMFSSKDTVNFDNANISVYPFGDEFYCFTESPHIFRIDPSTLKTMERLDVSKHVGIVHHTSHPHVTPDGSVYNQAVRIVDRRPHYSIIKFPAQEGVSTEKSSKEMFNKAEVVASVKARWPLHPSYMHSFGLTDNYYVIIEQPLTISIPNMLKGKFTGESARSCLKFFGDEQTIFHVVERATGKSKSFAAEAFFFFHTINQYEKDDHLVIDLCCYGDERLIDCLSRDAIENMNKNPDYANLCRGRPLRFVLPLTPPSADSNTNLVTLEGSSATACWQDTDVLVRPELLCNLNCEMPRINYDRHLGKPYRFFYGVAGDVEKDSSGCLSKVDTSMRAVHTWSEQGVYPSEPVFVPSPNSKAEDDGVILSSILWGQGLERQVGLLVLDAASWQELGRTVFQTPSPVAKDLHGWFTATV